MRAVSIPPSVRKRPPSSCGSRPRSTSRTYHLGEASFQERAVAGIHLQRERVPIGGGGFLVPFEAPEEVGAGRVKEVIAGEVDPLHELEPEFGTVGHRDRDSPVQL